MRWIGNAEIALEMLVDRALNRYAHGSLLADKQAIQWMMAESAMEMYAAKLMVCTRPTRSRTRCRSARKSRWPSTTWRTCSKIVDRAIQVHGALGYSTDTPLEDDAAGLQARLVDGADEVHMQTIARNVIAAYQETGKTSRATGELLT